MCCPQEDLGPPNRESEMVRMPRTGNEENRVVQMRILYGRDAPEQGIKSTRVLSTGGSRPDRDPLDRGLEYCVLSIVGSRTIRQGTLDSTVLSRGYCQTIQDPFVCTPVRRIQHSQGGSRDSPDTGESKGS